MEPVATVEALEELLSRPTPAVTRALAACEGDLVVLGAGGKMGPTLVRMACRAGAAVVAVARWTDEDQRRRVEAAGARTLALDLTDPDAVRALPAAGAVVFMAGAKFGTSDDPGPTWSVNAVVPGLVARRYPGVPTVAFSSGNVYPLVPVDGPGACEDTPPGPAGEYAWSVLARERVLTDAWRRDGTPGVLLRLNYATELRYGVLVDLAVKVRDGTPIDLAMGHANVIWQGDANGLALRCLGLASAPPRVLNLTGREVVGVRDVAEGLGTLMGREPVLVGEEAPTALLSDTSRLAGLLDPPEVLVADQLPLVASWVSAGRPLLGRPTHFEVRDGRF